MTDPAEKFHPNFSRFSEFTETLIISIFIAVMIFTYIFSVVTVKGDSMRETLCSGDRVFVNMLSRDFAQGDIVIINAERSFTLDDSGNLTENRGIGETIVKRVIASGGQSVDIDFTRGTVRVDGVVLDEKYLENGLTHMDGGAFTGHYPVTVPDGYYFVMGDNRSGSKDSRSEEIGFIPEDSIAGEVMFVLFRPQE